MDFVQKAIKNGDVLVSHDNDSIMILLLVFADYVQKAVIYAAFVQVLEAFADGLTDKATPPGKKPGGE